MTTTKKICRTVVAVVFFIAVLYLGCYVGSFVFPRQPGDPVYWYMFPTTFVVAFGIIAALGGSVCVIAKTWS